MRSVVLLRGLLSCALAALGGGCVTYRAPVHAKVQRGALDVVVDSAAGKAGGESGLFVTLQSVPEGVTLLDASVRTPAEPPCGEGWYAGAWGRSSGRKADQPLLAGETLTLQLSSEAFALLAKEPTRLDLTLRTAKGEPRCIPIPISDEPDGLDFEPDARFTVAVELALEGFFENLGSVQQAIAFPLVLGAWIDRVHVRVGAGLHGSGCPDTRCPITDDSDAKIDYSHGYVFLAGADTVLWEQGSFGFGASLHYRLAQMSADTFLGQDSEEFWMHGPVLAPSVLVVLPVIEPHRIGGSRAGLVAFEVPVGYAITADYGSSVSMGVNLRFRFTVF